MALIWEAIKSLTEFALGDRDTQVFRAKVPGGWFVRWNYANSGSSFFYPDPNHEWDGNSLP